MKQIYAYLKYTIFLLPVIICGACYEEQPVLPNRPLNINPQHEKFDFTMLASQEQMIYDKRGEHFLIADPLPLLTLKDFDYAIDRFRIRGQSTLNFHRKSYSVNLNTYLNLYVPIENNARDFKKFKLISMVFDYTYIEHAIAKGMLQNIELWPVHSFFTEVAINNNSQGIYFFIEDPEDHFLYLQGSAFILRRGYHNSVSKYEINKNINTKPAATYLDTFESIYNIIVEYSGEQLFIKLSEVMDLEQYFRKMAVDFLLKNGDYTDEVFFYVKPGDESVFGIFPWDYDDLFSSHPHEIGRDWSVGNNFGERLYNSVDDIKAEIGERLIYSIEDDLDYKIATDDYLYRQYINELEFVMQQIDDAFIEQLMTDVEDTIGPFYDNPDIIEQSQYDQHATNKELFETNLEEKRQFLLERRAWIINQL